LKITDLLILILTVAVGLAAWRHFWVPAPDANARLYLAAYLVLLASASLGAFFAWPRWRRAYRGYALFGWCNFAFVMRGGFGLTTIYDARNLIQGSQSGVVLAVLSALLATLLLEPPRARDGEIAP
jgi:hypothetical protein